MNDPKSPVTTGYSLWLMPQDRDNYQLQTQINFLAGACGTTAFTAHATLLALPNRTPADLPLLEKVADDLAAQNPPIVSEIIGVGMRKAYFQAVFYLLLPTADLAITHAGARLRFMTSDDAPDAPFMPHLSGVYGELSEPIRHYCFHKLCGSVILPQVVTFNQLALVDLNGPPEKWKAVHFARFTGKDTR